MHRSWRIVACAIPDRKEHYLFPVVIADAQSASQDSSLKEEAIHKCCEMVIDSFQSIILGMKVQVCDSDALRTPSSVVIGSAPKTECSFPRENQILINTALE